jgi:hypothetical protein
MIMEKMILDLTKRIINFGQTFKDPVLGRISELEYTTVILNDFDRPTELKPKYKNDWARMKPTLVKAVGVLLKSKVTRHALIFNDNDFYKNFQCFVLIHISYSKMNRQYIMKVYQRSGSIDKIRGDLEFFGYVAKQFEDLAGIKIKQLRVDYDSLHHIL